MSLCAHCTQAVTWDGEPTGKTTEVGGITTYVAEPTSGDKTKALIYLTDIFGLPLVNNKLLVDDFAKAGYHTFAPDLFDGKAPSHEDFAKPGFDIMGLIGGLVPATPKIISTVIDALKADGYKEFAALGYCYGGKFTFDLAVDKIIKVGAVSHPSLLKVPEDLERLKASGIPMLINSCETDPQYPPESQKIGDDLLGAGKQTDEKNLYKRTYYPGCTHGFAVKGDLKDEQVKFGKEDSFRQTVDWLKSHDF